MAGVRTRRIAALFLIFAGLALVPILQSTTNSPPPENLPDPSTQPSTAPSVSTDTIGGWAENHLGERLQGVEIEVLRDGVRIAATETAVDGVFKFADLPAGVFSIRGHAADYQPSEVIKVQAGDTDVALPMLPYSRIRGAVQASKAGEALTGAAVALIPAAPQVKGAQHPLQWTSANGAGSHFHLDRVPSDRKLLLLARATGFADNAVEVGPLAPGEEVEVLLELQRAPGQSGTVLEDGQEVPGAAVTVRQGDRTLHALTTDEAGRFAFDLAPGPELSLRAALEDRTSEVYILDPLAPPNAPIELHLKPGAVLEGILRTGRRALRQQSVYLTRHSAITLDERTITNANGAYALQNLPSGNAVVETLITDPEGLLMPIHLEQEVELVRGKTTICNFDLPERNAALEGYVTIGADPPSFANVSVEVSFESGRCRTNIAADPEGYYRIADLPAGDAWIAADVHGADGTLRKTAFYLALQPGVITQQNLLLDAGAQVHGKVIGLEAGETGTVLLFPGGLTIPAGNPFELQRYKPMITGEGILTPDGAYRIAGVQAGSYTLAAVVYKSVEPGGEPLPQSMRVVQTALECDGLGIQEQDLHFAGFEPVTQ